MCLLANNLKIVRRMKGFTGNVDAGKSNLFNTRSISKNDQLCESLGNVDELNSFVGLFYVKLEKCHSKM